MQKNSEEQDLEQILQTIFDALQDRKGEEITDLDITKLNTTICHHFVICHAESSTRVKALAESVQEKMIEKHNLKPFHKEGFDNAQWILLDYADVIVHIFQQEYRQFYKLEDLWADGIIRQIDN